MRRLRPAAYLTVGGAPGAPRLGLCGRPPAGASVIDMPDPGRVAGGPDETRVLLSGSYDHGGSTVRRAELRLYREGADASLGPYSLITSYVETDAGSVEMIYDEGYRGGSALEDAARFVSGCLGVSGLVERSLLALRQ